MAKEDNVLADQPRKAKRNMPKTKQEADNSYGVPDAENPEWTKEKFARSKRFDELPESLRNKLSAIQEASRKKRGTCNVKAPETQA